MASGRDPQGFVLYHLKFVQMGGGYLGEPDWGSIVKDGAHDGRIHGYQGVGCEAPARPSYCFHDIEGPRVPLDTVASVRAEGEVGVQRGTQEFWGPVQRIYCVTDSHLRVESGLVGIGCEQGHAGFLGGNGQLLSIGPSHQNGAQLVGPCLSVHNAGSRGHQREVVGIGRHV